MSDPVVSCLMPTANRRAWVPLSIATFLAQDFESRELIVLDDGQDSVGDIVPSDPRIHYVRAPRGRSLGAKRNEACRLARGEILVNWDDDDWSASWRLTYQVEQLKAYDADICGLDRVWFFDPSRELAWRYRYPPSRTPWLAGGTHCFQRRTWEQHPYPDVAIGEDNLWIAAAVGARVLPLTRDDFYVASVHRTNTSPRQTESVRWTSVNPAHVRSMPGFDLCGFRSAG
jgi:glycosyltransferase involved in cell wall biosynthesis